VDDIERGDLVDTACALLLAAILLRDMAGAMPPKTFVSMPDDIRNRMLATVYQDTFDRLPGDVQAAARRRALADPDVVEARRIHEEGQHD
jgi:hypothetical protein